MSFFGGRSYSTSEYPEASSNSQRKSHNSSSHSHSRSQRARSSSPSKPQGYFTRPSARSGARSISGSIFPGGQSRGIFNSGGSSSYYKRRPRDGYISMLMHKLQRMVKELWSYARRHPVKAFFAVVVPLMSAGGAIHGLMKNFGVKMPFGLDAAARQMGGGYYDSRGYGGIAEGLGGLSGLSGGGGGGWMSQAGGLMNIAKAFM